jgi:hypothetical protein
MELKFDGLMAMLQGQPIEWLLAAGMFVLCLAMLVLSVTVFLQRGRGGRR